MWNKLGHSHRVVIAEGSELFSVPMPPAVAAAKTRSQEVYDMTGCQIVGVVDSADHVQVGTDELTSEDASQLLLLGDRHSERKFRRVYLKSR